MSGSLGGRDGEDREGAITGDEPLDTGRLALDDGEERLPWLETEDDYDESEGVDTGRILGLALFGLIALAAIVGGIWWMTHRGTNTEPVADGSVIRAPQRPYKEAPKEPGGKTFAGTGDSSFAVSEGQSRPARLGQPGSGSKLIAPGPQPGPKGAVAPSVPDSPDTAGVGVQVGAFSSEASAEAAWSRLVQQYEALSGLRHRVVEGKADIGTVYRLQALAGDAAAANALCARLKSAGLACQVKH